MGASFSWWPISRYSSSRLSDGNKATRFAKLLRQTGQALGLLPTVCPVRCPRWSVNYWRASRWGRFTPGFVGDTKAAAELAEIAVMLMMFTVGMPFLAERFVGVRRIALPGRIAQIANV